MNLYEPESVALVNCLLQRTSRGDHRGFEELYRLTAPKLLGVAQHILGDLGEAEDVLQETFVAVWRGADRFDAARANASTWLTALLRYKAISRIRRRRLEKKHDLVAEMIDEALTPDLETERSESYRRLRGCLAQLRPEQQYSLQAAFFTGVTYEELARRSGAPLGTMKSRIRRGLLQLRRCLAL